MKNARIERIHRIIDEIQKFRFCGPSDDPDEITSVTASFRYLSVQFKSLVEPLLPANMLCRIDLIDVRYDDLYSAYDAHAHIDALLPDLEIILNSLTDDEFEAVTNPKIIASTVLAKLKNIETEQYDMAVLTQICEEINSCYRHGNIVATVLLMRAVLNYVPPVFNQQTFDQVVAQSGRTLKQQFTQLEDGLRKVADIHTHKMISTSDMYPSLHQVDPYKPAFELLLNEVIKKVVATGRK